MKELNEVLKDWEAVIGLEVHTELTTLETKMFCNCRLSHEDEPNANVCPVCLGMPGALPVPNEGAIRDIVMAGLALDCEIPRRSMFYRKHYFYPDMAKNFQTTQGPVAFAMNGGFDLLMEGEDAAERGDNLEGCEVREDGSYTTRVGIERIHMEEDAAKMVHVGGAEGRIGGASESLIDYNRCGTPLMELVTRPDIRTPEEARRFFEGVRQVFMTLGISDCSLEMGSMRCDANVSIRRRGEDGFGTKTEMKNLNSFRSLHDAISYEIRRQAEVLEEGGIVKQQTRHWDATRGRTLSMREKETADDYRLFPDPDLAPFDLPDGFIESCRERIPELPAAKRGRYEGLGVRAVDAAKIAGAPETSTLFDEAIADTDAKTAQAIANLLVNDVAGYLNAEGITLAESEIGASQLTALAALLASDQITAAQGREVVAEMAKTGESPDAIVDARGMRQTTDLGALEPVVDAVLARCTDQVQQYKDGNTKVVGFLVGQCMKESKGQGNPKLFNQLLTAKLEG